MSLLLNRRPMPLILLNECGLPKFVCTTLRPSLPAFPELYTLEGCAKFISEFMTYEPLEEPLHPPAHMPSPMSILSWQAADAFDAAGVLCSLLIGAGYNAFVVMGYASLAVTINDQSNIEFVLPESPDVAAAGAAAGDVAAVSGHKQQPTHQQAKEQKISGGTTAALIANSGAAGSSSKGAGAPAAETDEPGKQKKYIVRRKPQLVSKYLQDHPEAAKGSVMGGGSSGASTLHSSSQVGHQCF